MPKEVQFRRGDTNQNNNFKGAEGELSVNLDTYSIRVHNGITTGGFELARNDLSNVSGISTTNIYIPGNISATSLNSVNGNFTGIVTSPSFIGNLTGTATTSTNVIGGVGSLNSLNVSGFSTLSNVSSGNIDSSGIITATQFSTGSGSIGINSNTIYGPAVMFIDPAAVGDNTGILRIKGDLYIDGTQTIINSTTLNISDLRIGIAATTSDNILLDGAGIGIGSTSIQKYLIWQYSTSSLKSSENLNLASGKTYKINDLDVLSSNTLGSGVVNSSLTSVGTLNQLNVSGVTTSSSGFVGNLTGTATTATNLSDAANITTGTISTSRLSGTYNIDISGSSNYSTSSGVSTNVIGGIGSINSLTVSGITTSTGGFVGNLTGNLNSSGINTATTLSGTTITYNTGNFTTGNIVTGVVTSISGTNLNYSGITTVGSLSIGSTQVVSSARQLQNIVSLDATTTATIESAISNAPNNFSDLQVTGISTFTNGPVLIGSGTSTGTTSQPLQVTGGAYVSGNLGIGTTNPTSKLHLNGDINLDDGGTFTTTIQTITPTANRTVSVPDATGTLALVAGSANQVIYNNAGANAGATGFTYNSAPQTLSVSAASTTTSSPILNLSQTWNSSGTTFSGFTLNITDTASSAQSLLGDWQINGSSRFQLLKSGLGYYYNTSTSSVNYERAKIGWESNILRFGTEKLGTGVERSLELQTDGTTRLSVGATTGSITIPSAGVAGTSGLLVSGSWTTGAGTTNTKPQVLIEPVETISTTWSNNGTGLGVNAGVGFTGNLLDLQVNGTSQFRISNTGTITAAWGTIVPYSVGLILRNQADTAWYWYAGSDKLQVGPNAAIAWGSSYAYDAPSLSLFRDAAQILAQRNGTNAQTFRIYNTFTGITTNFERGNVGWTTTNPNVFTVGTEKGTLGGTARELHLQTDGTTRVAISTTGNVGINTTIPTQQLQINSGSSVVTIDSMGDLGIGTTNPTVKLQVIGDANISGVVTATDFNSSSDVRLKDNIQKIENPIDKINQLNGVQFNWKSSGNSSAGLIAQDVEKILPELVTGDEIKSLNYNGVIGLLVEVVKEQQKQIDELKQRLS